LIGSRIEESANRARTMKKHDIKGKRLKKHVLPNSYVFTPIKDITTDEVWKYLMQVESPWKASNKELMNMYRNANGGDCPLVIDDTTPSCGNSRFGCWVCTVVKKDKSMEALIDNGEEWMEPLMEIRDLLVDHRNAPEWREPKRRNNAEGPGPYRPEKRALILQKVLV
jgi:DNA sulfur modification protein DndC